MTAAGRHAVVRASWLAAVTSRNTGFYWKEARLAVLIRPIGPRIGACLRGRVATRRRPLSDRRPPEALSPAPDVHRQVDDEGEPGDGVPPAEGPGERQLYRHAAVPVQEA